MRVQSLTLQDEFNKVFSPSAGISDRSYIIQKNGDSSLTLLPSHSLAILSNFAKKTTNKTFSSIAAEI